MYTYVAIGVTGYYLLSNIYFDFNNIYNIFYLFTKEYAIKVLNINKLN